MKRFILAAGVAALAISAPAASQPGDRGGGNDRPKAGKVQKERGGGQAKARGGDRPQAKAQPRGQAKPRAEARQNVKPRQAQAKRDERAGEARAERRDHNRQARAERRNDDRARVARNDRVERIRDRGDDRRTAVRDMRIDRRDNRVATGYGVGGCPPGLMDKGCMPPGQAKKLVGEPLNKVRQRVAFRDLPDGLRDVYRDTDDYYYRYGGGYVYRVNRSNDVISSLLPLFGLGLTAGQQFPTSYSNYYMPSAYQPFYPTAQQYDYRYANGYIYEVDPYTGMIRDVDPMLGYGYGYGQMLPATYSAYNVPYQYRPAYQDTSDYHYRYAPGAIYQVDPQTSLITGIAALLGNGMTVGQPLPAGYGAYNVPYDYRDQYYDTPDAMYRYSAGNIYRVDPTTQLVTALVASILS